jgi:hypothetical protein
MSSIPTPGIHRGGCGHYWYSYSGALECPTCAEVAELKAEIERLRSQMATRK